MSYAFLPPKPDGINENYNVNQNVNNNDNKTVIHNTANVNFINSPHPGLYNGSAMPYGLTPGNNTKEDDAFSKKIRQMTRDELNKREGIDTGFFSLIPGLPNVFSKRRWLLVKILWLIVIILSLQACCFQIYMSISNYCEWPVVSNVLIQQEPWIDFPAITVCPFNTEDIQNKRVEFLKNRGGILGIGGTCNVDIWKMISYEMLNGTLFENDPKQLYDATESKDQFTIKMMEAPWKESSARKEVKTYWTFVGACFTVRMLDRVRCSGRNTRLVIEREALENYCESFSSIVFGAHEPTEALNIKAMYYCNERHHMNLILERKKFSKLSTPHSPCQDAAQVHRCAEKCISDKYMREMPCSLPFMAKYDPSKACNEADNITNLGPTLFRIMAGTNVTKECNCGVPCDRTIYTIVRDMEAKNQNISKLSFFFRDTHYIWVKEDWQFTFIGLLCDIGGNLGLYLGLSAISIFELIQNATAFCRATCCKSRRKA